MKKHLILRNNSKPEKFVNPQKFQNTFALPERDRNTHGQNLLFQISAVRENAIDTEHLAPFQNGYYAEVKGEPTFSLLLFS